MDLLDRARELRRLHDDPEMLVVVNVWDAASARVVAAVPGTRAIATASHSIAAAHGYADGEQIPWALMLAALGRIVDAVDVPVSADLEAGYGDPGESVRRAIGVGVAGANLEDGMRPLPDSVRAVAAAIAAAEAEGVAFALNARTDVYLHADGRAPAALLDEAVARGRAFLDAGATCVFVPGRHDAETAARLVEGIGTRKVSVLATPGGATAREFAAAGVARVSYGPWPYRAALTALADLTSHLLDGEPFPNDVRPLGDP